MAARHRSDLIESPDKPILPHDNELTCPALSEPRTASPVKQSSLPVRSPGTHLHPLLRRPPVTGDTGGSR